MANLEATARALLLALRALGCYREAEYFENTFSEMHWLLSSDDLLCLNQAISVATQMESNSSHEDVAALTSVDSSKIPECLRYLSPFFDKNHRTLSLVYALTELGRVESFESCYTALRKLFVEILGYDFYQINSLKRLGNQKTFSRLETVASYEGFIISVAEMFHEVPYSGPYEPIFKVYPYGLCIVVNVRRQIVRFVYTHGREKDGREVDYRTFVGFPKGRSINDNVLVWAHRLELIHPKFEDTQSLLRDRVETALSCTPLDLAQRWPSQPLLDEDEIPGPAWDELPQTESDSFFQRDTNSLIHWGLESVFRDRFPMSVAKGKASLRYAGYSLQSTNLFFQKHQVLGHLILVRLLLVGSEELESPQKKDTQMNVFSHGLHEEENPPKVVMDNFYVPCVIPSPDQDGNFWLGGVPHRYEPWIRQDGTLATRLLGLGDDDLLDEYTELFLEESEERETKEGDSDEQNESEEDEFVGKEPMLDGASIRTLLEVVVSRKLSALSFRLSRLSPENYQGLSSVYRVLCDFLDMEGRLELYSKPFLFAALTPSSTASHIKNVRPIRSYQSVFIPPSWACLEASAESPLGHWIPISAARLHPSGELCVPIRDSKKDFVLKVVSGSGLSVNDRNCNSDSRPFWWVASCLKPWASLKLGQITKFFSFLKRKGSVIREETFYVFAKESIGLRKEQCPVCFHSKRAEKCACLQHPTSPLDVDEPSLFVDPMYLKELGIKHVVEQDILFNLPGELDLADIWTNRELLGKEARSGDALFSFPSHIWNGEQEVEWPNVVRILSTIREDRRLPPSRIIFRLPPDIEGVISDISIDPVHAKFGHLSHWVLKLRISRYPKYTKAILPNGKIVKVSKLYPEDAPFSDQTGQCVKVLLLDCSIFFPENEDDYTKISFVDGRTGKEIESKQFKGIVGWIPQLPDVKVYASRRFRLLDNEPVAELGTLTLTEQQRRWIRLAHPQEAQFLEKHNQRTAADNNPWEPALGALLQDFALEGAREFVQRETVVDGESRESTQREDPTDITFKKLPKIRVNERGNLGGFMWQCECGILSGPEFVGQRCSLCETKVVESLADANRWTCDCGTLIRTRDTRESCKECEGRLKKRQAQRVELKRIYLPLPAPVLHPWYRLELAALLGLFPEELSDILEKHEPKVISSIAQKSLETSPFAASKLRMQKETDRTKIRQLGMGIFVLQEWLLCGKKSLVLERVPIVPTRYFMCGLPPGSPRFIHGGLVEKYRELRRAIAQVEHLNSSCSGALRVSSLVALQRAVDSLYGELSESSSHVTSFGSLISRIWPLSRSLELSTAVPGLYRFQDKLCVMKESPSSLDENIEQLQMYGVPCFSIGEERYWLSKHAQYLLSHEFSLQVAGIFAGINKYSLGVSILKELESLGVEPTDELTTLGLREFFRLVYAPQSRPDKLLSLLISNTPRSLPFGTEEAQKTLRGLLDQTFPCSDTGSTIVKLLLAYALGNWWRCVPNEEYPLGWAWDTPKAELGKPWSRALPPLRSGAWLLWPHVRAFFEPSRSLLQPINFNPLLSNVLGNIIEIPRKAWWPKEEEKQSSARTNELKETKASKPSPTPHVDRFPLQAPVDPDKLSSQETSGNTRVLSETLAQWLATQKTRSSSANIALRGKSKACSICGYPPGMHQCCPSCHKTANGEISMEKLFGFRTIRGMDSFSYKVPQPWCRECRTPKKANS